MQSPRLLLTIGTLLLAQLGGLTFLNQSSQAQTSSSCLQDTHEVADITTLNLRRLYLLEPTGTISELCIDMPGARLTLSDTGTLTLLQRTANTELDYYRQGIRDGQLREINDVDIDYYTSGVRSRKLKEIGPVRFDYFLRGDQAGQLREIGGLRIEYYRGGRNAGKIRRIGPVSLDYSSTGTLETNDILEHPQLIVLPTVESF